MTSQDYDQATMKCTECQGTGTGPYGEDCPECGGDGVTRMKSSPTSFIPTTFVEGGKIISLIGLCVAGAGVFLTFVGVVGIAVGNTMAEWGEILLMVYGGLAISVAGMLPVILNGVQGVIQRDRS